MIGKDFLDREVSGFRHGVVETFVLPGYYTVEFGSWLQTFRENTSIVFSRIKQTA
jgi:hypothetical protein